MNPNNTTATEDVVYRIARAMAREAGNTTTIMVVVDGEERYDGSVPARSQATWLSNRNPYARS